MLDALNLWVVIAKSSFMQCMNARSHMAVSIGFIFSVLLLAVFGMGAESLHRPEIRQSVVWLAALLALTLNARLAFVRDEEEGVLVQWQMLPMMPELLVLAQLLGTWLAVMLPVVVGLVPAAFLLQLAPQEMMASAMLLVPASWAFWLVSAAGNVLLMGNARAQGLHALIVLPLSIPIMIFGCAASVAHSADSAQNATMFLCGIALVISVIFPPLIAWLLAQYRNS